MVKLSLTIFSLLIIFLINKYRKSIGKKTDLIDRPDKIRKLHKKPMPLLGGAMIFSSFILINLYLIIFQDLLTNQNVSLSTDGVIYLCGVSYFH